MVFSSVLKIPFPTSSPLASDAIAERTAESELPSLAAEIFRGLRSHNDNLALPPEPGPAAELDCLRGVLPLALLAAAERRSADVRVGADRVLLQWGVIDEDVYVQRLAGQTGLDVESFETFDRTDCPLSDSQMLTAAHVGLLYLRDRGKLVGIIAPQHYVARRIALIFSQNPTTHLEIRLTTTERLKAFITQHAAGAIAHRATNGLIDHDPEMSAAPQGPTRHVWRSRLHHTQSVAWLASILVLFPDAVLDLVAALSALWFLAFAALRLTASFTPRQHAPQLSRLDDSQLPVYSVIVALYREARSVPALMQAIGAFDYPAEKLNVIFAVEPDDLETRAAIARLGPTFGHQVVIAGAAGPRTKPKALNCALPFVTGTFVAVYDAEDRPEPDQLRAALDAFRNHGDEVACAQASLCIDNPSDSLLCRMFAAEYAGQFDLFLPGAAALRMPLPLGGSSNHFRTDALRRVFGWDAYNVTEDADLGLRLARFGYRSVTFASTTFEEAPAKFAAWLKQRSRWMKGWMQTWNVHMRSPVRLRRDAGTLGFITINLIIGGNVLTALAHPVLIAELVIAGVRFSLNQKTFLFDGALAQLHLIAIAAGYLATCIVGAAGLIRRGMASSIWILVLTPIYWIALSIAAWRALFQLIRDPYRWEKTEHGLARSSHFITHGEPTTRHRVDHARRMQSQ